LWTGECLSDDQVSPDFALERSKQREYNESSIGEFGNPFPEEDM